MVKRTFEVVANAKEKGYSIIVGDAAGVDTAVVMACILYDVPFRCCGITPLPRNQLVMYNHQYHHVPTISFLQRDMYMAQECDLCVAIWNGQSRGTIYTYNYAKELGKPCQMINLQSTSPTPESRAE